MKKTFTVIILSTLIFNFSQLAKAGEPKVENSDSIFSQVHDTKASAGKIAYIVDTKTQLCILKWLSTDSSPSAPVLIDCQVLAKRSEWKPVIYWSE